MVSPLGDAALRKKRRSCVGRAQRAGWADISFQDVGSTYSEERTAPPFFFIPGSRVKPISHLLWTLSRPDRRQSLPAAPETRGQSGNHSLDPPVNPPGLMSGPKSSDWFSLFQPLSNGDDVTGYFLLNSWILTGVYGHKNTPSDAVKAAVIIDCILDSNRLINEQEWCAFSEETTFFNGLRAHSPLLRLMLIWSFQFASERKQGVLSQSCLTFDI